MKKPVLVIMAAGMGSRYGGLKQIDPVDEQGHIIMDFSIYDARRAGFEEVIFIIKKENEQLFREAIGDRISKTMKVHYAFQELTDLPEGVEVPEGRKKPWGTGHAVLSARDLIHGPFAVINADDYYGVEAFQIVYDFLVKQEAGDDAVQEYVMAGYLLKNTLTENGTVARGVCEVSPEGYLDAINERTKIARQADGSTAYLEDEVWHPVSEDAIVSMNAWALTEGFLASAAEGFVSFLEDLKDPMKQEYYLPTAVWEYSKKCGKPLQVVKTGAKWYGVTYKDDKAVVEEYIASLIAEGKYPGQEG